MGEDSGSRNQRRGGGWELNSGVGVSLSLPGDSALPFLPFFYSHFRTPKDFEKQSTRLMWPSAFMHACFEIFSGNITEIWVL
jgi:hypothetical protein